MEYIKKVNNALLKNVAFVVKLNIATRTEILKSHLADKKSIYMALIGEKINRKPDNIKICIEND